jgi:hypothetical protein
MPTKLLVSKVDRVLNISKARTNFPNKEDLLYNFKAGEPLEVEDYIADTYSKSYPQIFSIVDSKEKVKFPADDEKTTEGGEKNGEDFNAEEYLTENFDATEEQLKELQKNELFAIAKVLELTAPPNIGPDKLIAKIAQELKIRNEASK